MFKKMVKVSNLQDKSKSFEADFLIDTGALYSFVPEEYLANISWEPIETRSMVFADGRIGRGPFGIVNFEIEGIESKIACPVVAGTKCSMFLLGATALENFGVEADPVNKTLNPVMAIIGEFMASR